MTPDMSLHMVAGMVVDMEVHMVANTKVDNVATMVAVLKADMAVDNFFFFIRYACVSSTYPMGSTHVSPLVRPLVILLNFHCP